MSHISYSAFKNWATCPYYYKLTYEDRISLFNGNIYTAFGTAIHEVCENMLLKKTSDPKELFKDSFKQNLKHLPEDARCTVKPKDVVDFYNQGLTIIEYVIPAVEKYFGKDVKVFSAEEDLMVEIQEYRFKGFIDLVLRTPDGKYHIIDWKSCSWGWNAHRRSDKLVTYQLTFYKHYFCKKHNIDPSEVETHYGLLKRTAKKDNVELFRVTSGKKKTTNALNILNNALYSIDNKSFVKNKAACDKCDFFQTEYCG